MRNIGRKLALASSALLAGATLALAVAAPAQATASDCINYMESNDYRVGDKVRQACRTGSAGPKGFDSCYKQLLTLDVSRTHASQACTVAAK